VQSRPPNCGVGLLHFRVFSCCPFPHVTEQASVSQLLHWPLTETQVLIKIMNVRTSIFNRLRIYLT
jgi:hypothetical protein